MLNKLKNFYNNTSGNVAMIGALAIIPIVGSVAMAVDYSSFHREAGFVQHALDASALATAKYTASEQDEDILKTYAKNFFEANVETHVDLDEITFGFDLIPGDTSVDPAIPTIVQVTATLDAETHFSKVLHVDSLAKTLSSEISVGNRSVEIALVLDNSGSMDGTRMTNLKAALNGNGDEDDPKRGLIDIIFSAGGLSQIDDPVKFSIVPFNSYVNVGNSNESASWMDVKGWNTTHHENLNWNTYQVPDGREIKAKKKDGLVFSYQERDIGTKDDKEWRTRFTLYDDLDVTWRGCVEMRPYPYNTNDAYVSNGSGFESVRDSLGTSDGQNALFVPMFMPDMPDDYYRYGNGSSDYSSSNENNYHYYWMPSYLDDYYRLSNHNSGTGKTRFHNGWTSVSDHEDNGIKQWDTEKEIFNADNRGWSSQHERTGWLMKYQASDLSSSSKTDMNDGGYGPNFECVERDIVPLSTSQTDLEAEVTAMVAKGGTNIQQGISWGWRTLSSGQPFAEGRAETETDNVKYLIVLSDGQNSYYTEKGSSQDSDTPYRSAYGAWGYMRYSDVTSASSGDSRNQGNKETNRWQAGLEYMQANSSEMPSLYSSTVFDKTPDDQDEFNELMNLHTLKTCENVKNDGITIFSIAFDVSSNSPTKDLLNSCAGSGIKSGENVTNLSQYYYDVDGDELDDAMEKIALSIADMHIIK